MIDRYNAGMIFIGSVALLFVFIAGTFSRSQRRRAKARRQNADVYNALAQYHKNVEQFHKDLQPSEDAGERGLLRRRVN